MCHVCFLASTFGPCCSLKAMNKQVHDSDWCVLGLSGFGEEVCEVNVGVFICVCVLETW